MNRAWIVDGPWIARNVKNASVSSDLQIKDCGAYINCPNCSYRIDNSNVLTPWPGLPKGVKFEPTDEEVIEHLEAKCGIDGSKPNHFIQEFICSVNDINYTHPQNLPGVNKDGTSAFFFNKVVQAYSKGQRKRRRITPSGLKAESARWRKTGRTKPIMLNGVQKGCKKFMVLYKTANKGLKVEKYNWVLHQYHLGTEEEDIGEYVVSKIMYQQQTQWEKTAGERESFGVRGGPRTRKTTTPTQLRPVISVAEDEIAYDDFEMVVDPFVQGLENTPEATFGSTSDEIPQVVGGLNVTEDILVSRKVEGSSSLGEKNPNYWDHFLIGSENILVSNLENDDLGSLPDVRLFSSEESVMNSLESMDLKRQNNQGS